MAQKFRPPLQQQIWNLLIEKRAVNIIITCVLILMPVTIIGIYIASVHSRTEKPVPYPTTPQANPNDDLFPSHSLVDLTKLPLGDKKAVTSPQRGFVYSCTTNFTGQGAIPGPWIDPNRGTYNLTHKVQVNGNVSWPQAAYQMNIDGGTRKITSNGLPLNHNTGVFPTKRAEEAYKYEKNGNSIAAHNYSLTLPTTPSAAASPACINTEVGIAIDGIPIMSAFDAAGRDAMAVEPQDSCDGSPMAGNIYHYHGYSSCFKDTAKAGEHSSLLGYALDGYGIFGLRGEGGYELSSEDLDECHGHEHTIIWDGKPTMMYHYHLTHDFPYSVGCFKGNPVTKSVTGK